MIQILDMNYIIGRIFKELGYSYIDKVEGIYYKDKRFNYSMPDLYYSNGERFSFPIKDMDIINSSGELIYPKERNSLISNYPNKPIAPALLIEEILTIRQVYLSDTPNIFFIDPVINLNLPLINVNKESDTMYGEVISRINKFYPHAEASDELIHLILDKIESVTIKKDHVYDISYDSNILVVRLKSSVSEARYNEQLTYKNNTRSNSSNYPLMTVGENTLSALKRQENSGLILDDYLELMLRDIELLKVWRDEQ